MRAEYEFTIGARKSSWERGQMYKCAKVQVLEGVWSVSGCKRSRKRTKHASMELSILEVMCEARNLSCLL